MDLFFKRAQKLKPLLRAVKLEIDSNKKILDHLIIQLHDTTAALSTHQKGYFKAVELVNQHRSQGINMEARLLEESARFHKMSWFENLQKTKAIEEKIKESKDCIFGLQSKEKKVFTKIEDYLKISQSERNKKVEQSLEDDHRKFLNE